MTASISRTVNKGTADVGTYARSLSADPSGIATAIAECARVRISSPADLRTKAVAILNIALESSPPACKTLAVFSRRLHDRYPRFKADNGSSVTFASVMFHACQAELSSLHDSVQQFGDEMSNENVPEEVNSLRQPRSSPSDAECVSNTEQAKVDLCTRHAASIICLRHLDALQIFIACLYTQDVVPEDFVHKILDSHRFSSLTWPPPARHVGLMSACDMMTFCGKRLETLGSLCHVMPDWYSYLRSLQQDLSIPRQVHDRIAFVIKLRENQFNGGANPYIYLGYESIPGKAPCMILCPIPELDFVHRMKSLTVPSRMPSPAVHNSPSISAKKLEVMPSSTYDSACYEALLEFCRLRSH